MRTITQALAQTALAALFLASVSHAVTKHEPVLDEHGLEKTDCQIRCPPSSPEKKRVVLPALAQVKNNATGEWENVVECWAVSSNVVSNSVSDIDNVFRLNWEGGFDAAYQYIFTGDSFMPAHPAPEPSLIIMSAGAGDLRVPSGKCLRVVAGDIFFSVGTYGKQTAWWPKGTVVSDFYFRDGKIPEHEVVPELGDDGREQGGHEEL